MPRRSRLSCRSPLSLLFCYHTHTPGTSGTVVTLATKLRCRNVELSCCTRNTVPVVVILPTCYTPRYRPTTHQVDIPQREYSPARLRNNRAARIRHSRNQPETSPHDTTSSHLVQQLVSPAPSSRQRHVQLRHLPGL